MTTRDQEQLLAEANALYDKYAKHLETDHWGEYVAISRDGRVVLGEATWRSSGQRRRLSGRAASWSKWVTG